MLTIIKDIDICYDGIRPISLKEGQTFDVQSVLPNPEKAKVFRDRLIDLKVAVEKKEAPIEVVAEIAAEKPQEKPESEEPDPESTGKISGKKRGKKG